VKYAIYLVTDVQDRHLLIVIPAKTDIFIMELIARNAMTHAMDAMGLLQLTVMLAIVAILIMELIVRSAIRHVKLAMAIQMKSVQLVNQGIPCSLIQFAQIHVLPGSAKALTLTLNIVMLFARITGICTQTIPAQTAVIFLIKLSNVGDINSA